MRAFSSEKTGWIIVHRASSSCGRYYPQIVRSALINANCGCEDEPSRDLKETGRLFLFVSRTQRDVTSNHPRLSAWLINYWNTIRGNKWESVRKCALPCCENEWSANKLMKQLMIYALNTIHCACVRACACTCVPSAGRAYVHTRARTRLYV